MDKQVAVEGVTALRRRDKILMSITAAAEVFLQGSLSSWQENVLQVLRDLGKELEVKRIYVMKHAEVTAEKVITGLRYEWVAEGNRTQVNVPALQGIHLQTAGFGRWAGMLYERQVIYGYQDDLPSHERGFFMSEDFVNQLVLPVYVENQWWGFIGFEDYACGERCSPAEIEAFKTIAVTFGAAIRRKRMEEWLEQKQQNIIQVAREIEDVARFPAEAPTPILRLSEAGMVIYSNRAAEGVLGFWGIVKGEQLPEMWRGLVREVIEKQASMAEDITVGDNIFSLLFVPIVEGSYVNVYGMDVTQDRELSRLKSEFISMASHQLRSPLTTMRWYSEMLLNKPEDLSEKQLERVTSIHTATVHLAELVDDLLNLSRIERGSLEPEWNESDLKGLIQEVESELEQPMAEKQHRVTHEFDEQLNAFFMDARLIRQVVMNLLSNAVKYTPQKGVIEVRLQVNGEEVVVEVADTGIGIAQGQQDRIFEKFFRTKEVVESGIGGTGLGLSVAKMMVEQCGGRMWFTSQEGKGSTFGFSLPYLREKPEA